MADNIAHNCRGRQRGDGNCSTSLHVVDRTHSEDQEVL